MIEDDGVVIPIEGLAERVSYLERPVALPAVCDVSLGTTFTDPSVRADFAALTHSVRIRSYRLRDVTIDASLMMLSSGRAPIMETSYAVSEHDIAYALRFPFRPAPDPEPERLHIVACNRVHYNYYHWIVQCVPAIDWGIRNKSSQVALVLLELNPLHEETLALLGYDTVPRHMLQRGRRDFFTRAEFSEFLGGAMPFQVSLAAAATFGRMRKMVPPAKVSGETVYVARTDVTRRVAVNEAELIRMLRDEGVTIVVPSELSLREQIATFRAARLVIGPHGAGMTNIVFCEPGSFVYELLPTHYPNPCMNRLAQAGRLHYWADLFPTLDDHGYEHDRTWRIDVAAVATRLKALRGRVARADTADQRLAPARKAG